MSLALKTQTVTEIYQIKGEKESVIVITLESGRIIYVDSFDEKDKSITVQLRSFTSGEIGTFKRRIRQAIFGPDASLQEITDFLEVHSKIRLMRALTTYVSPISGGSSRLIFDHNRRIKPAFIIENTEFGSMDPVILRDFASFISTVKLER